MKKKAKGISFLAAQSGFANIDQQASVDLPERVLWGEVLIEALADLHHKTTALTRFAGYGATGKAWAHSVGFAIISIWIALRCGEV